MIRPLDIEVRSRLRSGIAITSISQCIEELVLNSLDAGASCISVRVDIPGFRVQVVDNGCGIKSEDLDLVGVRHATSKCHSLKDLERLSFHGFRGEALASIRDISGIVEIVSRHKSSYKTLCKIFQKGKPLQVTESCIPRGSTGTTVDLHDIFANLPVRRKLISDTIDFERIRHRIASIALIHPGVAFSLINEATGGKCLQTHKCQSILSTFSQLFGNSKSKSLREVFFEHEQFKASGYFSIDSHRSKSLQFLYINGRLVLKTRIHKLINAIIGKSALVKARSSVVYDERNEKREKSSPQTARGGDRYGVFVLNIECCVNEYDICLEPSKTLVEFQDWENVLHCVERCLELFLERENMVVKPDSQNEGEEENKEACIVDLGSAGATVRTLSKFEYQTFSEKIGKTIETGNIKRSLHSSTVFRRKEVLAQGSVENRSCGDKLDSDPAKAKDLEENSQDETNQHQENSFSETEYSEEQLLSDVSLDDSQTVERPQQAGELVDLDVSPLQQSIKGKEVATDDETIVRQQQCFYRTENSSAIQGTSLSERSGQHSEMLHVDKTKKGCFPCDSIQVHSISKECVLGSLNQVNASSSKECDVARNSCKAVSKFARYSTHSDTSYKPRLGRDKECATFPLQSFRYNKHPKRNETRSKVPVARTQAMCTSLEPVFSNTTRGEVTCGQEKRADNPSTCPAPILRQPVFTSPNPIMLPKPCTRKRTQDTRGSACTAGYSPSTKKYITLKRTLTRTPRLWLGRKQTSKRDNINTTDAPEEQATERDTRTRDLGSVSSERPVDTSCSFTQKADELLVTADVGEETCGTLSNALPGFILSRCDATECESPPSVCVEGNDLPADGSLAQIEKANFATHGTEVERKIEGDSEVMCIEHERAGMRPKISEEESDKRTLEETTSRAASVKTLDKADSTYGSEASALGREKVEVDKDRTQEEGEEGAFLSRGDLQVITGAFFGQAVSRMSSLAEMMSGVHCPMNSFLTERTEPCRDSDLTRDAEVSSGTVYDQLLCDSEVPREFINSQSSVNNADEEASLQNRNIRMRDDVSSSGQILSSSEVSVSNTREEFTTLGKEAASQDRNIRMRDAVSSSGQILSNSKAVSVSNTREEFTMLEKEAASQDRNIRMRDDVSSSGQILSNSKEVSVSNSRETSSAREQEASSIFHKEWTCTFDASRGRTLYINLRTGNSSFDPPVELTPEHGECETFQGKEALKQGLVAARQVPHSAAPHISFACTPWMPREGRRRFVTLPPDDAETAAESEGAESQKSLVLEMFDEHLLEQFSDKLCKWADTRALKEFETTLKDGSVHVSEMLQNWTNPVFAATGKGIMSLQNPSADRNQVRIHSVIHPYRFSKDMLDKMVVINQLDQKFIVCVLTRESSDDGGLVVVVDQHAAHERIRLEKLNADLFEGEPVSKSGKRNLKSSPVSPPLEITLAPNEARLVKSYRTEMERIGLRFTFGPPSESSNEVAFVVGIPSVFVERELSEVKRGRPSLATSLVKELITEHIEHLMSTSGVTNEIPKAISRIVSSQACHGAVKFGEPLGMEECEALIRSLAKCDLPFQCAHGRPSVVPLVDLDLLGNRSAPEEPSLPKLHKLAKPTTSNGSL